MSESSNPPWQQLGFMQGRTVETQAGSLHLRENRPGTAPQLLLFHGLLRNWRSYYPLLPALNNEMSLAALDFRGHGASTRAGSYFVRDYVDDAVAVIRQLPEPCFVFGHSLGAMVALAVASLVPERVRGVILEDPPFDSMGINIPTSGFLPYFQAVERCLTAQTYASASDLYEAFSDTVLMTDADGQPIRIRDRRDERTRRFMSDALMDVDPAVLKTVNAAEWMQGYDLNSLLGGARCEVELLQADAKQGGMLIDGMLN